MNAFIFFFCCLININDTTRIRFIIHCHFKTPDHVQWFADPVMHIRYTDNCLRHNRHILREYSPKWRFRQCCVSVYVSIQTRKRDQFSTRAHASQKDETCSACQPVSRWVDQHVTVGYRNVRIYHCGRCAHLYCSTTNAGHQFWLDRFPKSSSNISV